MSSNLAILFRQLNPRPALLVGAVTAASDGLVTVELPDGGVIVARGAGTVGQNVFVRDGAVEGDAPSLPIELIEI